MRSVTKTLSTSSLIALGFSIMSCSSIPKMESTEVLRSRATTRQKDGFTVRSTPLSFKEQKTVLSRLSPRRVIQPLWVEVENTTKHPVVFLPVGISRDYFPPDEVAFRNHPFGGFHISSKIDAWHQANAMPGIIPAGETDSGLVYAPQTPGTIAWNIELLGDGKIHRFAFAEEIPGFRANFDLQELEKRSTAHDKQLDWAGLKGALEKLPPCASDRSGERMGDPLNVVIVGSLETMLEVFVRNGWRLAEPITLGSSLRETTEVLIGGGFPTGPVSAMYFNGRHQDLALQRPRPTARRRNHMRLWLTGFSIDKKPVWIGQISRDIGVRFTRHTKTFTTHRVAPDLDESRDNLVAEAISTESISAVGWVNGVGEASRDTPRHNLTGDAYFTDGQRAVMFLSSEPVPTTKVRRLTNDSHYLDTGLKRF